MSLNDPNRLELIKMILDDDTITAEEGEILKVLLKEHVSQNAILEHENDQTFGQKAADILAKFAGSWSFLIVFCLTLIFWIILNTILLTKPYDGYPFILLNLVLSCVAAVQAPIIMMSQNRQEEKDRLRGTNDYKVNLKSEIIIQDMYQKLEKILKNQHDISARLKALEEKDKI